MGRWRLVFQRFGFRPLAILGDSILGSVGERIFKVSLDLKGFDFLCELPFKSPMHRVGRYSRILERVFRLQPTSALVVGDKAFIARRSEIYCFDFLSGTISLDFVIPGSRRVLTLSEITSSDRGRVVVVGEYFENSVRSAVNIWGRSSKTGEWSVLHQFAQGEIEHIHSVKQIGERVLILCGDVGDAASIWLSNVDFDCVKPLVRGRQLYRAAWVDELSGRVLYATDSQYERNSVVEISGESDYIFRQLYPIAGSSIYMSRGKDEIYFSSAIEGESSSKGFLGKMFDRKPGPGVESNEAVLYSISADCEMEEISRNVKDWVPFYFGQFGTYTFPSGEMPSNSVVAYGVGLSGVDGCCLVYKKI